MGRGAGCWKEGLDGNTCTTPLPAGKPGVSGFFADDEQAGPIATK